MAQKRMLNKCISNSEKVNDLSYEAMVIYTWGIPHTDDVGLLPASPRKLKSFIGPMWDMTLEDFGFQLETIVKAGLWKRFQWEGEEFFFVVGHQKEQTLKKDRKPQSIASNIEDWKTVDSIWKTLESLIEEKVIEEKRSEMNVKEESTREGKVSVEDDGVNFKNIPF